MGLSSPVGSRNEVPLISQQQGFEAVLRNRPFCALWVSQIFSQVADKIFFILLVTMVANLTRSNTVMSAALVAYTIPNVFFGALAGVFVDRWDKRQAMMMTNVLRGGLILLTAWFHHHLWIIIPLAFLVSTFSQPFTPAESSAIPLVVTREQLLTANSLFATTVMGSIIVGFTLGEPIIDLAGVFWAPVLTASFYLVSTLALLMVRYTQSPEAMERQQLAHAGGFAAIWEQLVDGWQGIRDLRAVRLAIGRLVVLFSMFAGMSLLAILFAKTRLHTNFSWILAVAGGGLALGAGIVGRFGHGWSKDKVVEGGFALAGICLIVLELVGTHSLLVAYTVSALIGFASAFVAIPMQTVLQETIPEALRGKIFGAQNMAVNVATTVPMAVTGPLADLIGFQTVFLLMGAGMMASAGLIRVNSSFQLGPIPASIPVALDEPERTIP